MNHAAQMAGSIEAALPALQQVARIAHHRFARNTDGRKQRKLLREFNGYRQSLLEWERQYSYWASRSI